MKNYLTVRKQCVCIYGVLSKFLNVDTGVPQGSILGPLFYVIFTNDLPEIIHEHQNEPDENPSNQHTYNVYCIECGGLCCFADDSTYSISGKTATEINQKLGTKYEKISEYMNSNRLKLNSGKTHLMVMMTDQMKRYRQNFGVKLDTITKIIKPTENEKMLGGIISSNLKWTEHILNNKESLVKSLTKRLNGLQKISKIASFKNRKMIADGIFMSKLIYLMPLWGGCEKYLLQSLQVIQNKAARAVTRLDKYTSTEKLLNQCNWMSVNQLIVFHSLTQVFKTLETKSPKYLYDRISGNFHYTRGTRFSKRNRIGPRYAAKNDISNRSFQWRATKQWNMLPEEIQKIDKLHKFKQSLTLWIKLNIPLKA